jgi:hypothetical protein
MPAATYKVIETQTLPSTTGSVTFNNIPQTYTDLVMVIAGTSSSHMDMAWRANNDTGNNYFGQRWQATTSSQSSDSSSNANQANASTFGTSQSMCIFQYMSYSSTTLRKTCIQWNSNYSQDIITLGTCSWNNTAAITRLDFNTPGGQSGQYVAGTRFTLYGIKAE